jgi:5-methylcytosine-specific restriction endonuclease McrA
MKFELEPDNRNCPDSILLEDLRRVAAALGKEALTRDEYDAKGRFSAATLRKRFGSWNSALERSGLHVVARRNIPKKELLDDLKRVSSKLGKPIVSTSEYRLQGKFSPSCVSRSFRSWKLALQNAGLSVSPLYHERSTDDELLENIERVWEHVGRQPRKKDLELPQSRFSCDTYRRRFGSFRKALETFVASVNEARPLAPESERDCILQVAATEPQSARHKTSRNISWRMRFLVMRRDNFKCRITGRSPATDPSVILDVDHIIPWAKGGETVMENLQTLCREINMGKSNLDMHQADTDARRDLTICKDADDMFKRLGI